MSIIRGQWNPELARTVFPKHIGEDLHAGVYASYAQSLRATVKYLDRLGVPAALQEVDYDQYKEGMEQAILTEAMPLIPTFRRTREVTRLALHRVDVETGIADGRSSTTVMYSNNLISDAITPKFTSEQVHVLLDHVVELDDLELRPTVTEL